MALYIRTGTAVISTINSLYQVQTAGIPACANVVADGAWSTTTSGIVYNAIQATVGSMYTFCYDGISKWYISNTSLGTATVLPNGSTATNQTTGDTSTQIATDQFVANTVGPVQTTANAAIPTTQKGAANGVATLGTTGIVPTTQLPFPSSPSPLQSFAYDTKALAYVSAGGLQKTGLVGL